MDLKTRRSFRLLNNLKINIRILLIVDVELLILKIKRNILRKKEETIMLTSIKTSRPIQSTTTTKSFRPSKSPM